MVQFDVRKPIRFNIGTWSFDAKPDRQLHSSLQAAWKADTQLHSKVQAAPKADFMRESRYSGQSARFAKFRELKNVGFGNKYDASNTSH